jgi:hypothetical protein
MFTSSRHKKETNLDNVFGGHSQNDQCKYEDFLSSLGISEKNENQIKTMVISHFRLIKSTNFKSLKVSIAGENKAK